MTSARALIFERDRGRCVRCSGPATDWHHRRSRRVRDEHTDCRCNGVALCRACHSWAHGNPTEAKVVGFVVSQWEAEPWTVPFTNLFGTWLPGCGGDLMDFMYPKK